MSTCSVGIFSAGQQAPPRKERRAKLSGRAKGKQKAAPAGLLQDHADLASALPVHLTWPSSH
ncbi:hypothetical protein [Streptantibioticus ferralitis]|uniref:Uncharacterized protein n=1 Tax=Streptantibioticus ferralitis TaxID=236510 RepID=A0ABT5YXW7_9ACTN|nr:hypothetical protein [Streptantibioticus ferralitis]MDF2256247.1 hypothetical protein [Streptantibioticus ferralitis]